MSSKVATIADAVVAFINAQTYSQDFTATRVYTPAANGEELEDLNVHVVGASRGRRPLTRAGWLKTVTVLIGVRKRLTQAANAEDATANSEVDALMLLCEEIEDSFDGGEIGNTGAVLDPSDSEVTFEAGELRAGKFLGVITLVFVYKE